MKFIRLCLAVVGLLWACSAESAHAAFVDVGSPYTIVDGALPGGVLTVGNVQFSNFQVKITGNVPALPSDMLVQAVTDGTQYGLYFNPQNFAVNANQYLNATLSFEIRVLAPLAPVAAVNGAAMTLTGVTSFGDAFVTIGESLRPTSNSAPVGLLSVIAGPNIAPEFAHDEVDFAAQTTLYVRKDILINGGTAPPPINFSHAHLSEFIQLYDVITIPEPNLYGLSILGGIGSCLWLRRRNVQV